MWSELYQTFLGYIFILMILGYKTWKDLFKPKISSDAPARECVGPRDIRSWLQNFKCPQVTEFYKMNGVTYFLGIHDTVWGEELFIMFKSRWEVISLPKVL